ncbi:MAG TPA: UDP-N-acetylmuramate dehydrogenase [Polyangia bacterium]|nr:UDP-N-acetylmuramate dehydrogenase [Polyangia bacterium]
MTERPPLDVRDGVPLAPLTTLELGGPARHFVEAADDTTIAEALRWADARSLPVVILGGGSNVVIGDGGWDGLVVRIATRGRRFDGSGSTVKLTAAAGEPWDDVVADTVARNLAGLECLSGIPGLVGATPIQNVGAYGQEVADCIVSVRVLERATGRVHDLAPHACEFGYRDSAFKRAPDRHVVLGVTFALRAADQPTLRYRELTDALAGTALPSLAEVRAMVLALRRKKSMVIVDGDPNRRSVGSFFTNPIVTAGEADGVAARAVALGEIARPEVMPRWPTAGSGVKLSAGWLIEHAGIRKGRRHGAVGVSTAHALALVHHGGGSSAELLELAHEVGDAVHARFGMTLLPEPTMIGVAWSPSRP